MVMSKKEKGNGFNAASLCSKGCITMNGLSKMKIEISLSKRVYGDTYVEYSPLCIKGGQN